MQRYLKFRNGLHRPFEDDWFGYRFEIKHWVFSISQHQRFTIQIVGTQNFTFNNTMPNCQWSDADHNILPIANLTQTIFAEIVSAGHVPDGMGSCQQSALPACWTVRAGAQHDRLKRVYQHLSQELRFHRSSSFGVVLFLSASPFSLGGTGLCSPSAGGFGFSESVDPESSGGVAVVFFLSWRHQYEILAKADL
jgi:hypothetical protein